MSDSTKSWLQRFSEWRERRADKLPRHAWSYFHHIVALYHSLVSPNTDPEAKREAEAIIKKGDDKELKWADIFRLENIALDLQPPDLIQRNVWIVRERFREITCPTVYKAYLASNPPTETQPPEKLALLRADLSRLLDVLHWYYALLPDRERLRKRLTQECIIMILVYTVILVGVLIVCLFSVAVNSHFPWLHITLANGDNTHPIAATAACVVYWGIIGGFVSSQRRMQNLPSDGDPLITVLGLDNAGYYLWLSPLLGAVFAVVLTWMFMGGVVTGVIFPTFAIPKSQEPPPGVFLSALFKWPALVSYPDYAKLFLWSFLAGFAERLVPDNLDRLATRLEIGQKSTAPAPPAPNPAPTPRENIPNDHVDGTPRDKKTEDSAGAGGETTKQPDQKKDGQ